MTLPSRKKHQITVQTVAPRLLVGLLSLTFLFPALPPTAVSAAEPQNGSQQSGFESDWQNRSQPTWLNNAPSGQGLRESSMLNWGPKAKPIALSHPRRADKPSVPTSPLVTASKVPASIVGERQGKKQVPEDIRIALNPATGKPGQKYTGISLLQPEHYLDPTNSASDAVVSNVQMVGYSVGADYQAEQRRAAEEARLALEEKVRVLQTRALSNLQRRTSRIANGTTQSASKAIAFAAPTPPIGSYANVNASIQRSNHQAPGGGDFYQTPPAQPSTGNQHSLPQGDSIPDLLNEPPAFSPQDLNDLQQVQPRTAPQQAQQPTQATDPFGQNNGFQPNTNFQPQSQQPQQQPSLDRAPRGNSGVKPFDDLFKDPTGNATDDDLEDELRRLEEKSGDLDADLEKELRDLGLDDEDPDDETLDPDNQDDNDDTDLPSRDDDGDGPQGKTYSDCGRIYDDRDCCAEDKECQTAFDKLNSSTLASLSLDISPSFDPSEDDPNELINRRSEKLMSSPSRSWMDRTGNIVANGTLEDLRQGKVHIRSDGGGTVTVPYRELSRDDLCFVNAWWQLPAECPLGNEPLALRNWTMTTFTWKAAGHCHKPLYFEHLELERYGHSAGPVLQPVLSGAHFFANVILLPYNQGIHPPTECLYDLGNYRPGDCAPWLIPAFPMQKRGSIFETALGLGLWGLL